MGWSSICIWQRGRVQSIAHGYGRRAGGVVRFRSTAHAACVQPRASARPGRGVALRSGVSFLHGRRMSASRIDRNRLVNLNGGPALKPGRHTDAPWPDEADGSSPEPERRSLTALILECGRRTCRLPSTGVSLQPVLAIQHITEIPDEGRPGWWRCLHMRAAPGLRLHLLVAVVAREARLPGFVSVAVSALSKWPVLASRRHRGSCDPATPQRSRTRAERSSVGLCELLSHEPEGTAAVPRPVSASAARDLRRCSGHGRCSE